MDALTRLHYDPKWLEYDLMDQQFLREQITQYETTSDKNTEHYRYAAFRRVLASASPPDDITLDRYIELAELDEDPEMTQAVLELIVREGNLTEERLDRLKTHPAFVTTKLQNLIERIKLLRLLDSSNVTDEVIERCLFGGESEVQRKLLSRSELSRKHLELIKERGVNRAIRNLAKDRLRRQSST